jgi:hypothetical protein
MAKTDEEFHYECTRRFIELANEMSKEKIPNRVISASLMSGSCFYATYLEVGNKSTLNELGINLITEGYKKQLELTQKSILESEEEKPTE